jgi:hypothetical protein
VTGACVELWPESISLHVSFVLSLLVEVVVIIFLCACHGIAFVSPSVSSEFAELPRMLEISEVVLLLGDWSSVCDPSLVVLETGLFLPVGCFNSSSMPCMDLWLW